MKEYCRQADIAAKGGYRDVIERDTQEEVEHIRASAKIVEDEIRAAAEKQIRELTADADARIAAVLAKKQESMRDWEQEADAEASANAAAFDEHAQRNVQRILAEMEALKQQP